MGSFSGVFLDAVALMPSFQRRVLATGSESVRTAMMFGVQFFLNAGSTTGVLPVIGVTFPFLSYGGTSMLVDCFLLAVVNAIRRTE